MRTRIAALVLGLTPCCLLQAALIVDVTVNTSPLISHPAGPFALEFVFDDGSSLIEGGKSGLSALQTGDNNNQVLLSNFLFTGGGPTGSPTRFGGAFGSIATTIRLIDSEDTNFFIQPFVPGSQLKFRITFTNNVDESTLGDTFTFAILDQSGLEIPTLGGTFYDALLEIDFDSPSPDVLTFPTDPLRKPLGGGSGIRMTAPLVTVPGAAVPEPATGALAGVGVLALFILGRRRRKPREQRKPLLASLTAAAVGLAVASHAWAADPAVTIASPSGPLYTTTAPQLVLNGSASSASGILKVLVSTNRGYSGAAALTMRGSSRAVVWRSELITLQPGLNRVTVTATDNSGRSSTAGIDVNQSIPGSPAPSPLPSQGVWNGKVVTYEIVGELAIGEGDIILGPANSMSAAPGKFGIASVGINDPTRLWPKVNGVAQVPYVETRSSQAMKDAIVSFNKTFEGVVQWVPRTNQPGYVEIDLNNQSQNSCFASLGYAPRRQNLAGLATCDVGVLLHEMGHNIGLFHEQSRSDRDQTLTIDFSVIPINNLGNYRRELTSGIDIGLYDLRSIMQYGPRGFTKNGNPEMESKPVGIPFGYPGNFSAGDIDAVRRMYAAAPVAITIASNPPGAQLIVDNVTITAPQTFNWALNSPHTLSVPPGAQAIGGKNYIYGAWNDDPNATHNITVNPGNGLSIAPRNAPQVSAYLANFIELTPVTVQVLPAGAGTVTLNPPPITVPGLNGQWYPNRQIVTVQAAPAAGFNFYRWTAGYAGVPGLSANPLTTPVDRIFGVLTAQFTDRPVTAITTNVANPGAIQITVDDQPVTLPINFAEDQDPAWAPGSNHNVNAPTPLGASVRDPNTRYLFAAWSDRGAAAHAITASAAGVTTLVANYDAQYKVFPSAEPACGGVLNINPPLAQDRFVAAGTQLTLTAQPAAPFQFVGWAGTVNGTGTPLVVPVNNELSARALFNLTTTPLAITGFTPANAPAGSAAFTLTLNGTGFVANSFVFINGVFRESTFVNPTTLTVQIQPEDVANPGVVAFIVQNTAPPDNICGPTDTAVFPVLAPQ